MRPLATLRHRNPDTCGHAVCIRFLTAFRLLHASSRTLFLELMPKHIPNMGTLALKPFTVGGIDDGELEQCNVNFES